MKDATKSLSTDESDPQSLAERAEDPPGSFLDMYRTLSLADVAQDEQLVEKSVIHGVVPEVIRYGVMQRGTMRVLRGIVKSTEGDAFYFNWAPQQPFHLVPADDATKQWEADKLLRSCQLGCDLRRAGMPVLEEEEDAEKADLPGAASVPRSEEQWAKEQESMEHEVHPGSTQSALPDDPTQGRQWHQESEPLRRATDGCVPLGTNDGQRHWSTSDLMKAYGAQLQQTAPSLTPNVSSVEAQYMQEALGVSQEQIAKGMRLPARHRLSFEQWKTDKLRNRLLSLNSWLEKRK